MLDDDGLGDDPFMGFLLDNPETIQHVTAGLQRVVAGAVDVE